MARPRLWVRGLLALLVTWSWFAGPAREANPASAAPTAAPTISGCPTFPADNVWNTRIDTLPVHPRSAAYLSSIGLNTGLHADFGSGTWDGGPIGIPYTTVPGSQPRVPVSFQWPDESDPGPYPIPPNPPIEGGPNSTGDRHILVVDTGACVLYELYSAYPNATTGGWDAGSGAVFPLTSNQLRPLTWTSADAAGLPIFPGLVRYDEVAAGQISHAIRFTAQVTQSAFDWPARHEASSNTSLSVPPMGTRVRLKASFDISGFSTRNRVILQAMKTYGMLLADNGSNWYVSGAPDSRWDDNELHALGSVLGSQFEVVDESSFMVDVNSGQAGTPPAPTPTSAVASPSLTATSTATPTRTATVGIPTPTRTSTTTNTASPVLSATPTPSATATPTRTATATSTAAATTAATAPPSFTPTGSPTLTPSRTATATQASGTPSPAVTATASTTSTVAITPTASRTGTATPPPSWTAVPSSTATRTSTATPSAPRMLVLQGTSQMPDTWISPDYPTDNFGTLSAAHLQGSWTPDRLLFAPDLSSLPVGASVQSATLQIYAYKANSSGDTIAAYDVLTPWRDSTATYSTPWSAAGMLAGSDYQATPAGTAVAGGTGWITVDVTTGVRAWQQSLPNRGLMVRLVSGAPNAHYRVYLADTSRASIRPKLTIAYTNP